MLWALILLIQVQVAWLWFTQNSDRDQVAVADMKRVFDEFELTEELQGKIQEIDRRQKIVLDSLETEVRIRRDQYAEATDDDKRNIEAEMQEIGLVYRQREERFQKGMKRAIDTYDEQIWTQLNAYIEQYGQENQMQVILGNTDGRNVPYVGDTRDITDELIAYLNDRYLGK